MAEVLQGESKQKAGFGKTRKATLRVDLTPMVDLGFLLISFFVFTTTMANPKAMKLNLPDDTNTFDSSKTPANRTLNIILAANNEVYAYNGNDLHSIKNLGSDVSMLRKLITNKKLALKDRYGSDSGMVVLIKPTNQSTYSNVINALDEMLICNIKTYVLMDANNSETAALK